MKRLNEQGSIVHTQKVECTPFGIAKRIVISVRQEDIDNAMPNCPSKCALALALLGMGLEAPRVGLTGDGFLSFTVQNPKSGKNERHRYRGLSRKAITATYAVDNGNKEALKPFVIKTGYGHKYHVVEWVRARYAGGPRQAPRTTPRSDKGVAQGRTLRRQKLQAALKGT